MPPCNLLYVLTRALAASTPACYKAGKRIPLFSYPAILCPASPADHGGCLAGASPWFLRAAKAVQQYKDGGQWLSWAPPHQSSVCICPCLSWPSTLASSSRWLGEGWTETGKSEIGNGELLQEPTPYLPVLSFPFSCCSSFSFVPSFFLLTLKLYLVGAEDFIRSLAFWR